MERVAYIGFSMGTILGVAFVALDERVKTAIFTIGGSMSGTRPERFGGDGVDRARLRKVAELIDPASYAPLVSPRPVLMINGLKDEVVPPEAGERLFAAFGEPKRIEWYDGGHYGMTGSHFKIMREFLRKTM
jgi:cephalosporin-C deacetylase-like acetyl esterase